MPGHSLTPPLTLLAHECPTAPLEVAEQYEARLMMDATLACSCGFSVLCLGDPISPLKEVGGKWKGIIPPICTEILAEPAHKKWKKPYTFLF